MDVLSALRTRRSIGKLQGDVSEEQIRTLIQAAVWAPNHRLTEPWRFVVLRGAARERVGRAWGHIAADKAALRGEAREALAAREAAKFLRAPVLIVVAVHTDPDPVTATEDFAAVAAAAQNLLLAAHALELGAIWRTGEAAHAPEMNAHFELEPTDRIVAIMYVGQPAMEPPKAQERESEKYVRRLS